jgi:hypothetical protein
MDSPMTIKELIKALEKYPSNWYVTFPTVTYAGYIKKVEESHEHYTPDGSYDKKGVATIEFTEFIPVRLRG